MGGGCVEWPLPFLVGGWGKKTVVASVVVCVPGCSAVGASRFRAAVVSCLLAGRSQAGA